MAMTMADNVIRKACDRCHTQKLSCRRVGDEACERCVRLKTDCKYSPSLRYKKHQPPPQHHPSQQHSQAYQELHLQQLPQRQQQQLPSAETSQSGRRSPKRRRTESDPSLVPPEAVAVPIAAPLAGELVTTHHADVTPDSVLDLGNFNFNFDQLEYFAAPAHLAHPSEHLSHPLIPNGPEGAHDSSWDHQLAPSSSAFGEVAPTPFSHLEGNNPQHIPPAVPQRRGRAPTHNSPDKRQRPRAKQRARQITLRQTVAAQEQPRQAPSVHWMAELSEINSSLLDLTSALPQHGTQARTLGRPSDERFKHHGFPIDEMFQLTRRVADILDHLSAGSSDENNRVSHQPRIDNSDPGNSMFILSTYVRLLDMYQKVFSLVRKELTQTESDAVFAFWKLPDVTVGSFAVESSPPLQMSLTIQVAEEFLSRLRRSTSALGKAPRMDEEQTKRRLGDVSLFSGVVDVSFQAVKSREESLSKHLAELRGEIEALLDS